MLATLVALRSKIEPTRRLWSVAASNSALGSLRLCVSLSLREKRVSRWKRALSGDAAIHGGVWTGVQNRPTTDQRSPQQRRLRPHSGA